MSRPKQNRAPEGPAGAPAADTPGPGMQAPTTGVRVRMYRQGLGDCFLLALPTGEERPFFMLIDCGVLIGPEGAPSMEEVVRHIHRETGGRIDVLVATHEHKDHLNGFRYFKDLFRPGDIGEVWAAWTEDPDDPLAQRLRARYAASLRALTLATARLNASEPDPGPEVDSALSGPARGLSRWITSLLAFDLDGDVGRDSQAAPGEGLGAGAGERPRTIAEVMRFVVNDLGPARFLRPNQPVIAPARLGGRVRVFVLGPPRDEDLLARSRPSGAHSEVYERSLSPDAEGAFLAAALNATAPDVMTPAEKELFELSYPFDSRYRVPLADAFRDETLARYYGPEGTSTDDAPGWRRIDSTWLRGAGELALKLNNDVNNTSLALAIQLVETGHVLLFPGDAQVGNCLSWLDRKWTEREGLAAGQTVTGSDLLRAAVLYKVGHHASHNATLREKGLELMTHPDLVALIPVHEGMAHLPKGGSPNGWDMPFPPLLERLAEKTKGRVLRADSGLPTQPRGLSAEEWKRFLSRCNEDRMYVEYDVPG